MISIHLLQLNVAVLLLPATNLAFRAGSDKQTRYLRYWYSDRSRTNLNSYHYSGSVRTLCYYYYYLVIGIIALTPNKHSIHYPLYPLPTLSITHSIHYPLYPLPTLSITHSIHYPLYPLPTLSITHSIHYPLYPLPTLSITHSITAEMPKTAIYWYFEATTFST